MELDRQLDDGNRNIPSKFGRTATNEAATQLAVCRLFERATVSRSKGDSASRFCRGIVIRTLEHSAPRPAQLPGGCHPACGKGTGKRGHWARGHDK